jgi:ethanolamine utilization protein EutN
VIIGRVKAPLVSTAKLSSLAGKKLLVLDELTAADETLAPTGREFVGVDAVGAGTGEIVLAVSGSSASMAQETGRLPTDVLIVGIVDDARAAGLALAYKKKTGEKS